MIVGTLRGGDPLLELVRFIAQHRKARARTVGARGASARPSPGFRDSAADMLDEDLRLRIYLHSGELPSVHRKTARRDIKTLRIGRHGAWVFVTGDFDAAANGIDCGEPGLGAHLEDSPVQGDDVARPVRIVDDAIAGVIRAEQRGREIGTGDGAVGGKRAGVRLKEQLWRRPAIGADAHVEAHAHAVARLKPHRRLEGHFQAGIRAVWRRIVPAATGAAGAALGRPLAFAGSARARGIRAGIGRIEPAVARRATRRAGFVTLALVPIACGTRFGGCFDGAGMIVISRGRRRRSAPGGGGLGEPADCWMSRPFRAGRWTSLPRALPWAGLFQPFRLAEAGVDKHALGACRT